MQHPASPTLVRPPRRPARRSAVVTAAVALTAAAVVVGLVMGHAAPAPLVPFSPGVDDGLITEGESVGLADGDVPAVARLDPALRDALRRAELDAAADGLGLEITSGWRSEQYQRWLLEEATRLYASEEIARQYVATPEQSSHVTGHAVDLGPIDTQFWLIEHGSRYGICQTYANERWHFELATEPGGSCPAMKRDAAG